MKPARIELKLVLDEADVDINLDTFSQRFNIQKRVYLIQLVGCDLGYRYGWYIRGPYSRNLTADAFTLRDELAAGEKDHEDYTLSPLAKERVARAKQLWAPPDATGISNDQWLELLASLHYLKHIAYWAPDSVRDFEAVFGKLIESKPQFASANAAARAAWGRLDEFGLVKAKALS